MIQSPSSTRHVALDLTTHRGSAPATTGPMPTAPDPNARTAPKFWPVHWIASTSTGRFRHRVTPGMAGCCSVIASPRRCHDVPGRLGGVIHGLPDGRLNGADGVAAPVIGHFPVLRVDRLMPASGASLRARSGLMATACVVLGENAREVNDAALSCAALAGLRLGDALGGGGHEASPAFFSASLTTARMMSSSTPQSNLDRKSVV